MAKQTKQRGFATIVIVLVVLAILIIGGAWYYFAHQNGYPTQSVLGNQNIVSTGTPVNNPITQNYPSLLPVQIGQPATGTQWGIGKTVDIQWAATVPWNGSGANSNVDSGSFAVQLTMPNGSSLTIASGSAEQFLASEGDVYSQFKTSYAVPSNASFGKYSVVIEQTVGEAHASGEQPVIIGSSSTSPVDHSKG